VLLLGVLGEYTLERLLEQRRVEAVTHDHVAAGKDHILSLDFEENFYKLIWLKFTATVG